MMETSLCHIKGIWIFLQKEMKLFERCSTAVNLIIFAIQKDHFGSRVEGSSENKLSYTTNQEVIEIVRQKLLRT